MATTAAIAMKAADTIIEEMKKLRIDVTWLRRSIAGTIEDALNEQKADHLKMIRTSKNLLDAQFRLTGMPGASKG